MNLSRFGIQEFDIYKEQVVKEVVALYTYLGLVFSGFSFKLVL